MYSVAQGITAELYVAPVPPWQIVAVPVIEAAIPGIGFTVIVKISVVPLHVVPLLVNDGDTVIVAIFALFVRFVAINDGMVPVPESPSPIDGSELVQV